MLNIRCPETMTTTWKTNVSKTQVQRLKYTEIMNGWVWVCICRYSTCKYYKKTTSVSRKTKTKGGQMWDVARMNEKSNWSLVPSYPPSLYNRPNLTFFLGSVCGPLVTKVQRWTFSIVFVNSLSERLQEIKFMKILTTFCHLLVDSVFYSQIFTIVYDLRVYFSLLLLNIYTID